MGGIVSQRHSSVVILRRLSWVISCLIVSTLFLAGCTPFVAPTQPLNTTYAILHSETTLGQTFVASFDGLSGLELNLAPEINGDGNVILHLRSEPGAQDDLATARIPVETIDISNTYRFTFDPISQSRRQYYYAYLELQGEGRVRVGMAWGGSYLDGAIYQDHHPYNSQMTFALVYDRSQALMGTLRQLGSWLGMLVFGTFLYILPGWAIFRGFWSDWNKYNWAEKIAYSAGLSLAVIPLLFLWTDLTGLHLGASYAWLPGIVAVFALLWMNRENLNSIRLHWPERKEWSSSLSQHLPDIVLVIVLVSIFIVRFWSVRNLDLPMWGDSYQHTVITQLMLDNGGLFDSWEPYARLESLTYHYGFHADSAVFGWLTSLPATRAVIWVGQILNGLAVLAVYPFTFRLSGSRWGGVVAVLMAGMLFQIPMSYVNWGRYTQLAGQIILPAFALLFLDALRQERYDWKELVVVSVLLSGLALTHYRILIFALAVFPAFTILEVRRKNFKQALTRMMILGIGSALLFLPWFLHVYGARILAILGTQLTTPASAHPAGLDEYNAIGNLSAYLPIWAWVLIPLVIVIGLWLRKKGIAFIAIWWLIILLTANPAWLNLPGTGILSNFTVFIASYIPVAILLGAGIGWLVEKGLTLQQPASRVLPLIIMLMIFVTVWTGGNKRLADVRINVFSLAARPDLRAAVWILENTPSDAKFVVNYFFSYLDQLIVGSDGGWWLPLLTQRQTNLPPLTYGIENSSGDEYLKWTNGLAQNIQMDGITNPHILEQLVEGGFEYIYIGQRQGAVNNPGPIVLDARVLSLDSRFQLLYQNDLVWIFKIIP